MTINNDLPELPKGWRVIGEKRSPGLIIEGVQEKELVTGYVDNEVYIYLRDDLGNETGFYFPIEVAIHPRAMLDKAIEEARKDV